VTLSIARSRSTVERFPLNPNPVYNVLRYLAIESSYILPRREYQFFGVQPHPPSFKIQVAARLIFPYHHLQGYNTSSSSKEKPSADKRSEVTERRFPSRKLRKCAVSSMRMRQPLTTTLLADLAVKWQSTRFRRSPGGTEKNHGRHQPGYPMSRLSQRASWHKVPTFRSNPPPPWSSERSKAADMGPAKFGISPAEPKFHLHAWSAGPADGLSVSLAD
jgi:hypothetical protein